LEAGVKFHGQVANLPSYGYSERRGSRLICWLSEEIDATRDISQHRVGFREVKATFLQERGHHANRFVVILKIE
jgi:hypothetical protein